MTTDSWIVNSLGIENVQSATVEASRRRLQRALSLDRSEELDDEHLKFVANALELSVFDLLDSENTDELRIASARAFQIARVVPREGSPIEVAQALVRFGCIGVLGERSSDVKRILSEEELPVLPLDSDDWGVRVWSTILDMWLRLLRKSGWSDLDALHERIASLRAEQAEYEPGFLNVAEGRQDVRPAWELMVAYHLAKAAEILGTYQSEGSSDGHFDILEQLDAQFDRAIAAASRGQLMEQETFARLLSRTAQTLVANSIWTITRGVNSRVTSFVKSMMSREHRSPIFEMLPPQRRTLREEGLLGSAHRSVVVSLPTSSGKTLIAQFRILQALNQFDRDRGWVAYVAPTRALVNQLTLRMRRDYAGLGINVEKVSPALEVDGLEADMLSETSPASQFRILVTTPEKLDLMLRGGWEQRIGRPLTLVVVDEAHGLGAKVRGLKLELLLATINRECRHAQFLLLTPFVPNAAEIARWLAPESNKSIELGADWVPNDRTIAIARPQRGTSRGEFRVELLTQHTSSRTIEVPEALEIQDSRPLGLSWSEVSNSPGRLAAATAQLLQHRGTVIVLVGQPRHSWGVAETFKVSENRIESNGKDLGLSHIQQFLVDEMGADFPLASLLEYGVGVHHAGLSDDTRTMMEWLTEREKLRVLVATTTIAQGVNFPVSGVVFASHQYPYGQDMPPEDFWNITGRAGRLDQGDLGIIALAAHNEARVESLRNYIGESVGELNSTLIDMIREIDSIGSLHNLEKLSPRPEWSAFLQYLAHTYRQFDSHERFAAEVEQVLRGTLGFQSLRRANSGWADALVNGVYNYAARIRGAPLELVDATGFSWETVSGTLGRLGRADLKDEVWSPDLFSSRRSDLQRMVGVMLQVPELRESLNRITGGPYPNGDTLTRIICDWVQGRPLTEMASEYFMEDSESGRSDSSPVTAMTRCCRNVFGRLTQTASWGLAALQSLTIGSSIESLSEDDKRTLRNLPARVYYGVNSDEAVALRLLGVPRSAAVPLASHLGVQASEPLHSVRERVRLAGVDAWRAALGNNGTSYHHVWSIIEGEI